MTLEHFVRLKKAQTVLQTGCKAAQRLQNAALSASKAITTSSASLSKFQRWKEMRTLLGKKFGYFGWLDFYPSRSSIRMAFNWSKNDIAAWKQQPTYSQNNKELPSSASNCLANYNQLKCSLYSSLLAATLSCSSRWCQPIMSVLSFYSKCFNSTYH